MSTDTQSGDGTEIPTATTGTDPPMALPADFDGLNHDQKLRVIENHSADKIRAEIDRILGIEYTEYSAAQAHQFGKHEPGLFLRGFGDPKR